MLPLEEVRTSPGKPALQFEKHWNRSVHRHVDDFRGNISCTRFSTMFYFLNKLIVEEQWFPVHFIHPLSLSLYLSHHGSLSPMWHIYILKQIIWILQCILIKMLAVMIIFFPVGSCITAVSIKRSCAHKRWVGRIHLLVFYCAYQLWSYSRNNKYRCKQKNLVNEGIETSNTSSSWWKKSKGGVGSV